MKILIIEDEKIAADYLISLLAKHHTEFIIMRIIDTVTDAVQFLKQNSPDLIFCDIHLADDISFKIFELVEVNAPIIFTTAYDNYAIKAFKVNSIDYLLKPINEEELKSSIIKFKQLKIGNTIDIQALSILLNNKIEYKERFLVNTGQKFKSITATAVAYFYADQKIVCLVTLDGQKHVVDHSLEALEQMVNPRLFFRINRQFIINMHAIINMYAYSKSRIKLELKPACEKETIVSVERSSSFKAWLNK